MKRVLCIALNPAVDVSCEADVVQPTHKTRTRNQQHHPGGGGVNVARVICELGGRPDLLVLCGGASGTLLEGFLTRLNLRLHMVRIANPTRIAYIVHENRTGFEYRFVPEGPVVAENELECALRIAEKFDGEYMVASGSLPRGVATDTYLRLAKAAERNGVRFVLDTSGEALKETLSRSQVFLVKPSLGELERLAGKKLDEAAAQRCAMDLVEKGAAAFIAVSMGAQGSFLAGRKGIVRLPARHVNVRSAVGAGDSFVGAMTHSLACGNDVEEAFHLGSAAGSAAVMTPGTELCRRKDVEELYEIDRAERRKRKGRN